MAMHGLRQFYEATAPHLTAREMAAMLNVSIFAVYSNVHIASRTKGRRAAAAVEREVSGF